jgi:hypothetical protein
MQRTQAVILRKCRVNYCGNCCKTGHWCCSFLVQTSSAATIFTPHSLGTNWLQPNHTRSMSVYDFELQYDKVSAVLPITQRKYCPYFWIPLVNRTTACIFRACFDVKVINEYQCHALLLFVSSLLECLHVFKGFINNASWLHRHCQWTAILCLQRSVCSNRLCPCICFYLNRNKHY